MDGAGLDIMRVQAQAQGLRHHEGAHLRDMRRCDGDLPRGGHGLVREAVAGPGAGMGRVGARARIAIEQHLAQGGQPRAARLRARLLGLRERLLEARGGRRCLGWLPHLDDDAH